jgi:uncharacterized protein (TIGR03066 family)
MRILFGVGIGLLVICALSGCGGSSKREAMIIGEWDVKQTFGTREITGKVEFRKDGSMTTLAMGMKMDSKYKFIDDNNVEIEMSVGGRKMTEKNKIESITNKQMILVDPRGGKAVFTRVR